MTPDSLQPETEVRQPTYDEFKKIRPVWTTSLRRGVEYAAFRFGLFLGKNLSLPRLQKMGRGVGSFAYKVLRKDRGIVEKHSNLFFRNWMLPSESNGRRRVLPILGKCCLSF